MNFISSSATSSLVRARPAAPVVSGVGVGGSGSAISVFDSSVCGTTLGYCIFYLVPLTAVRHVRKMRGGAQSHLVEADDGHWYVVKFRNNPQHRRILVNELLCAEFLEYLKIAAPETALVEVSPEFLADNQDVHISLGSRRIEIEPG